MTEKRFIRNIVGQVYDTENDKFLDEDYVGKSIGYEDGVVDCLNNLHEENKQLREHFIYLIGTALEDKECRKIYAKGLLEIFDDCSNLDEAKNKIKEYLE